MMQLHEELEAFLDLVQATSENMGLPQVYIEKDYWVTKALKHLSESTHVNEVVFKGGTSLSKAYRLIDRFSEDIDLAIFAEGMNDSARKNLLKDVERTVANGLKKLGGDPRESKGSKYRKTVYQYPRCIDSDNFGQASQELLLEVNAFTNPEPSEFRSIQSFIAETLLMQDRADLITRFGLESFSINVLSVKRTLVEKMLGVIKDSYYENPVERLSDRIRHLYDICLILREEEYKNFVQSLEFVSLCKSCIVDEKLGMLGNSECLENKLVDAPLFTEFSNWRTSLETTYDGVFVDLVFGEKPEMDEIVMALSFLHDNIAKIEI